MILNQGKGNAKRGHPTQFSTDSPSIRANSLVLFVTNTAPHASACAAIHKSFDPISVPAAFRRANCTA
jgi:hypothetical protein